jgi:phage-related protein
MFHFSATFIHIFAMYKKIRTIVFYKEYFQDFFSLQNDKVKDKIIWTLTLIEELERISGHYFKYIEGTDGLYEIRLQLGSDILRIFCFFDSGKLIIIINGFQKKTQKTPKQEIVKALKIKQDYENEK